MGLFFFLRLIAENPDKITGSRRYFLAGHDFLAAPDSIHVDSRQQLSF